MKLKGKVVSQIEASVARELPDLLAELRENGLSASQMHQEIASRSGVDFNKRQLERWLKALGIEFSREEAGRQRWREGLMSEAARKTRDSLRTSMVKGSRIEEQIRWALKSRLETIQEYETIIGFANWTILDNSEVDIPIVCIRKSDQRVFRFALEVDGKPFHPAETKWLEKMDRIQQAGWHPLRVVIGADLNRKAHQVYVRNNVHSLVDIDGIITEITGALSSQQHGGRISSEGAPSAPPDESSP